MSYGSALCFAATFESVGLNARPTPDSCPSTLDLARRYTSEDECLPARVTLGDFLAITRSTEFDPLKTAFFMPTASGPCRFGQYENLIREVLKQDGHDNILILSPTSSDNYDGFGGGDFLRTAWRALVVADLLEKLRLKTRPYEVNAGDCDDVYKRSLNELCELLALRSTHRKRLGKLTQALTRIRDRFWTIPVKRNPERTLVGVVGEIFCRLNEFSNQSLIRTIEKCGGEVWLSGASEWIWYTGSQERRKLCLDRKRISKMMFKNKVRSLLQHRDEKALLEPLRDDLKGYEEADVETLIRYSEPYLPVSGALGEMVLSVGKVIHLKKKGVHGIIDVSPFTCMNGIIAEAVYPTVSRDHSSIPIRSLYPDATSSDLTREIEVFMELARNYRSSRE